MVLARPLACGLASGLMLLLTACEPDKQPDNQALVLPERFATPHVTDQTQAAGLALALSDNGGGCQLQVGKMPPVWLKPMAPCYFMKSPGTAKVQVYRHDKTTAVVALVGTPVKGNRCGQEVQGLVIKSGAATPSAYIMQGSIHCADQGLQNFQYELFAQ
ncbi:hypothetical protein [Thiothrix subterranea]|uniref:DUF3455 domain-containing protein n=1 Tax=Thiothrix subterranea TaxID=2735563 RepID=A0AA51MR74_9GAMM|nr:hypothetical protein [Thiothrix subterranea]MDQ5768400.1 hypothetical protein [Thiothrix subterranea]WML86987.1 hypothetical protein RCG00_01190 [Thiothrix subterranea]